MRTRPNRWMKLFYDGDWHTTLTNALRLAREGTRSQEKLAAVTVLERLLAWDDECIHTITFVQPAPPGMDAKFLMKHIEQSIDVEPAALSLSPNEEIELTITARGDWNHVNGMAKAIFSSGVSKANSEIWRLSNNRYARLCSK